MLFRSGREGQFHPPTDPHRHSLKFQTLPPAPTLCLNLSPSSAFEALQTRQIVVRLTASFNYEDELLNRGLSPNCLLALHTSPPLPPHLSSPPSTPLLPPSTPPFLSSHPLHALEAWRNTLVSFSPRCGRRWGGPPLAFVSPRRHPCPYVYRALEGAVRRRTGSRRKGWREVGRRGEVEHWSSGLFLAPPRRCHTSITDRSAGARERPRRSARATLSVRSLSGETELPQAGHGSSLLGT